jgi:hypothetical protein
LQICEGKVTTRIYIEKFTGHEPTNGDDGGDNIIILNDKSCGLILVTHAGLIPSNGITGYLQIFCGISISASKNIAISGEIISPDDTNLNVVDFHTFG